MSERLFHSRPHVPCPSYVIVQVRRPVEFSNSIVCTVCRQTLKPGASEATVAALTRALEKAGVEFIDENGGGPGVRLRKRQRPKKPK